MPILFRLRDTPLDVVTPLMLITPLMRVYALRFRRCHDALMMLSAIRHD